MRHFSPSKVKRKQIKMGEEKKSNKIDIDQSSLLSLKAELLRKKSEALANQSSSSSRIEDHVPSKKKKISQEPVNREENSNAKAYEYDESNDKVKKILEMKAKYYERMQKSGQNTSLILFREKAKTETHKDPVRIEDDYDDDDDDDDFVEFTDCFGRTRKIPKSEYISLKRQESVEPEAREDEDRRSQSVERQQQPEEEIGESFLKQREDWRRQEQINSEQNEVFYQDLLFNEAREHGTGFYAFSTDHSERDEQKEKFKRLREETEKAQSQRNQLKKQRDDIIKNRVANAKLRIRQKLGLPPEEEEVKEEEKHEEKEQPTREPTEEELERERLRKEYVRPWDKDKVGESRVGNRKEEQEEWAPSREKFLLTQDEWVAKQRETRENEFAPVYSNRATTSRNSRNNDNASSSFENDVMANLKYIRKKFE